MSIARPIARPITSPIAQAITKAQRAGGGSDPLLTAALALSPIWLYDHKDIASFFSDAAMTTPASVDGPVGAVLDKSGNGWHRTQSSAALQPTLRQDGELYYLEYNTDFLSTASISMGVDEITVCLGVQKTSDASVGMLFESGAVGTNGSFCLRAPSGAGQTRYTAYSQGTVVANASDANEGTGVTRVLTAIGNISGDSVSLQMDNEAAITTASDQGTGNYADAAHSFGRRKAGSEPFSGIDFGGLCCGTVLAGADLAAAKAFVADRCGVSL